MPKDQEIRPPLHVDEDVLYPPTVRVQTKQELKRALYKRTSQIVIGDKKLARPFELLLWARELRWWYFGTLLAALCAYAISQGYGVRLRGENEWGLKRIGGEITLTPTRPRAPPGLSEE
jgi:hypothetical protein